MSDSSPYRRYVVFQVRCYKWAGSGPCWHERLATAAEGFQALEARIAAEYLDTLCRPQVALVDCSERRVLGTSLPTAGADQLVAWAERFARVEPDADIALSACPAADSATTEAQRAPAPDDDAGTALDDEPDRLEQLQQQLVDRVVDSLHAGRVDDAALGALCELLECGSEAYAVEGEAVLAVHRDKLASWLADLPEGDVRDRLDLDDDDEIGLAEWTRLVADHLLPQMLEDGDESHALTAVSLAASSGRTAVLIKSMQGYSFSGVEIHWFGVRRSWAEFEKELAAHWFTDGADFAGEPAEDRAAFIASARGH